MLSSDVKEPLHVCRILLGWRCVSLKLVLDEARLARFESVDSKGLQPQQEPIDEVSTGWMDPWSLLFIERLKDY